MLTGWFRTFLTLTVSAVGLAGIFFSDQSANAAEPTTLERKFQDTIWPFLDTYCISCHGKDDPEAMLNLSRYSKLEAVVADYTIWESVLARVEAGEMPPAEATPRPVGREVAGLLDWIREIRNAEAERNAGDPGPVLARRLSNAEYNYTIRDLTGVDMQPTATFPVDPANEAGFDNSGESLAMSPALLAKYLAAARQVVEHLVLTPTGIAFAPHPVMTNTDRDRYCVKQIIRFYERQPTDYADYFFAAWRYRHQQRRARSHEEKPPALEQIAAEQGVSPKYLRTVWNLLEGKHHPFGPIEELRAVWHKPSPDPAAARTRAEWMRDYTLALRERLRFTFRNLRIDGGNPGSQPFVLWKNRQYVAHRRLFNAANLLDAQEQPAETAAEARTEIEQAVSSTLVRASDERQAEQQRAAFELFCSVFPDAFYISERGRDYVDDKRKQMGERGRLLSAGFHSMMGYFRDDQPLYDLILDENQQREIDRLWQQLDFVTAAPMRQYAGFLWFERTDSRFMRDPQFDFARAEDKSASEEAMIQRLAEVYLDKARASDADETEIAAIEHYFREINSQIRWVEDARLAAEPEHLRSVLRFAERAYRRPLAPHEADQLERFYRDLREADGLSHEEAVQDVIVSVLMSPHFCYRLDLAASAEGTQPLNDFELASRLSYFLWSSLPDDELLDAAAGGTLRQPAALQAQVQRMLGDERVRGLAVEFGLNWLDCRRFEEHNSVDRQRFPEFDDDLRQAMVEEPTRFLIDIIQRDRPVLDLLYARDTFVNAVLAQHYGLAFPQDVASEDGWIHIEDAADHGRGGLLPMAVFLTKNAPGLRTSPVKRGYWVVRRLLGERIPPPPADVPELPEDEAKLGERTLRETLAAHREHASCAGCHERFDSIGLVFEGFGPIGERRRFDLGRRPIDDTAVFPDGEVGSGVEGLRRYIRHQRERDFVQNLCRKLLAYALGRSLILSDDSLLRKMQDNLATHDHRFSSLITAIVSSPQFLRKRGLQDERLTQTSVNQQN